MRHIFFSVSKDDGGVKKIINGLRIEMDDMPPHLALFWSAVLWIIDVGVEFFDHSDVDLLLQEFGKNLMPLSPLELSVKFIEHACGELHVPLR